MARSFLPFSVEDASTIFRVESFENEDGNLDGKSKKTTTTTTKKTTWDVYAVNY